MAKRETDMTSEKTFNRTGIMTNPELSAELIAAAESSSAGSGDDPGALTEMRAAYLQEQLPIGSPPAMPSLAGDSESPEPLEGMAVLLDKLGERLAFERQGTRLYQAVIQKCELLDSDGADLSLDDLQQICDEELQHFKMLQKIITDLGGDATVQTPSADVVGVMSRGVVEIACDPRTNLPQTLQALLTAELADNDGWQLLQDLAAAAGQDELQERCRDAYEQEQEHLEKVRDWITAVTLSQTAAGSNAREPGESRRKPARKKSTRPRAGKASSARKSGGKSAKKKTRR